jgi:uncharacterized protein
MIQKPLTTSRSVSFVGLIILSILLMSPINVYLSPFLGEELAFLIYYTGAIGIPYLIINKICPNEDKNDFSIGNPLIILYSIIIIIALQLTVSLPIANQIPMSDEIKELFNQFGDQTGIFSILTIVLIGPIIEELIFRGYILHRLLKSYSPVHAILVSSILFGAVHLNPWQFVSAFVIGCFAGWVYYRTNNILYAIIIHIANNAFAFSGFLFTDSENRMDETLVESFGGGMNYLIIILVMVPLGLYSFNLLKNLFDSTPKTELKNEE